MMKHFAIDLLSEYGTEDYSGTQRVVNPEWWMLNRELISLKQKTTRRNAKYFTLVLHTEDNIEKIENWITEKGEILNKIKYYEHLIEKVKVEIRKTPEHFA